MAAGGHAGFDGPGPSNRYRLFAPWVLLTLVCLASMWVYPGGEVVPFHLIWIGFALVYGFEAWPLPLTYGSLATAALVSGAVLVKRASEGVIAWEETAEIILMVTLASLVVWHVRRRQAAVATVTQIADHQVSAARERERLARLTSHEMRTPLTIASGYVDLLLAREDREDHREDLAVVHDELGRLIRAGDRLLRMIRLEDLLPHDSVDVSRLVEDTVTRWSAVADRTWVAETAPAALSGSQERLRACLDTLIENAVRYTEGHDAIRVFCRMEGTETVWVGVADAGPGFTPEQTSLVNGGDPADLGGGMDIGASGPGGQTGYGLGIVREIVTARHGLVRAGRSREGGALVLMALSAVPARRSSAAGTGHGHRPAVETALRS